MSGSDTAEILTGCIVALTAGYVAVASGLCGTKRYRVYRNDTIHAVNHGWFYNSVEYTTANNKRVLVATVKPLYVKVVDHKDRPSTEYD